MIELMSLELKHVFLVVYMYFKNYVILHTPPDQINLIRLE